jgi:hypothetical protein
VWLRATVARDHGLRKPSCSVDICWNASCHLFESHIAPRPEIGSAKPTRRYRLKIDIHFLTNRYLTGSLRSDSPFRGVQFILRK